MRNHKLIAISLAFILLTGCAAFRHKNPELPQQTLIELNVADQLRSLQNDYISFFTNVRLAKQSGELSAAQVDSLVSKGKPVELAIERANSAFKTWRASPESNDLRRAVLTALQEAADAFAGLTSSRLAMGGKQ